MPNLANLRENVARVSVPYLGETITVYYRPVELGDRSHRAQRQMEDGDMEPFYAELARLVIDWDITDGDAPVPVSSDGFKVAGIGICGAVWNAILADARNPTLAPRPPSRGTPIPWPSGSPATAASAPPPTTTPSSETPNGHTSPHGISPDYLRPLVTPTGSSGSIG